MEIILFYLEFLPQDIFTAFGIYTLIYLILKAFNKNQKIISFDFSARKFIIPPLPLVEKYKSRELVRV